MTTTTTTPTQVQTDMAGAPTTSKSTFALIAPFFPPRVDYAEDQPYARAILTTHVLNRGFQTGAFLGLTTALVRTGLQARSSSAPVLQTFKAATPTILRTTGAGSLIGTALIGVGLVMRMNGRQEIEWKDRAYRLAHNRGQRETDAWAMAGEVAGAAGAVYLSRMGMRLGALGVVGAIAAGNAVAVEDYVLWRHVVRGGKRSGDE